MPTQVNACDCLVAMRQFASAMIELEEHFYQERQYDESESPKGEEDAEMVAKDRQYAHDALTKVEKVCGHNRATQARDMIRELNDGWEQSYQLDPHDLALAMTVVEMARQMQEKGGCSGVL